MAYTSPTDARSDLFLSGAVYLFGPTVLNLLAGILRLDRVPGVRPALILAVPVLTTVVVPALLIRYRRESLRDFGFAGGGVSALALGVAVAVPLAVATAVSPLLGGGVFLPAILDPARTTPLLMAGRMLTWFGVVLLAVYCTVKARDAFRGDPRPLRIVAHEIGRIVALVALVATLLLLVAVVRRQGLLVDLPLLPLGAIGSVVLAVMSLRGPSSATRAVLVTPLVILALRPFALVFDAVAFVAGIWQAALLGGIGLAIGVLHESRRSAYPAIGIALVMALFTGL